MRYYISRCDNELTSGRVIACCTSEEARQAVLRLCINARTGKFFDCWEESEPEDRHDIRNQPDVIFNESSLRGYRYADALLASEDAVARWERDGEVGR